MDLILWVDVERELIWHNLSMRYRLNKGISSTINIHELKTRTCYVVPLKAPQNRGALFLSRIRFELCMSRRYISSFVICYLNLPGRIAFRTPNHTS